MIIITTIPFPNRNSTKKPLSASVTVYVRPSGRKGIDLSFWGRKEFIGHSLNLFIIIITIPYSPQWGIGPLNLFNLFKNTQKDTSAAIMLPFCPKQCY